MKQRESAAATTTVILLFAAICCLASTSLASPASPSSSSSPDQQQQQPFIPHLKYKGHNHYDFGYRIGSEYRALINDRFARSEYLAKAIAFYQTDNGRSIYNSFMNTNMDIFGDYWEELRGMSDGSGQPLYVHVLSTLSQEISYYMSKEDAKLEPERCSDYLLLSKLHAVVGHNEDSSKWDHEHMILVTALFPDYPMWTSYVYAGDLPTGAWGFSEWGFAFSMMQVQPTAIRLGGYGRNFIARRLLEVWDWNEVYKVLAAPGQAIGHSYSIMQIHDRTIANVEVAGQEDKYVTYQLKVGDKPYFHPNIYMRLNVSQTKGESSLHRLARVAALPLPSSPTEILSILGDQFDTQYPIFHDETSERSGDLTHSRTLSTVIFDLDWKTATVYYDNPRLGRVSTILNMLANTTTVFGDQ